MKAQQYFQFNVGQSKVLQQTSLRVLDPLGSWHSYPFTPDEVQAFQGSSPSFLANQFNQNRPLCGEELIVYLLGKLLWWSHTKNHGIVSVEMNGKNVRYFLHLTKVVSGPDVLKSGQFVQFTPSENPAKPGMLPQALNATVSIEPFPVPAEANQAQPQSEVRQ